MNPACKPQDDEEPDKAKPPADAIETFHVDGTPFRVSICLDTDPMSPREWDNIAVLDCAHRNCKLGDVQSAPRTLDELREEIGADELLAALPLYLYDHSGISMSCGDFGDRFDSGQVGWGYVTRANALKMGYDLEAVDADKTLEERMKEVIRSEVKAYDEFLTGQVYGYIVETDDAEGDHVDSCWGFYGGIKYVREEAIGAAKSAKHPNRVAGKEDASCAA